MSVGDVPLRVFIDGPRSLKVARNVIYNIFCMANIRITNGNQLARDYISISLIGNRFLVKSYLNTSSVELTNSLETVLQDLLNSYVGIFRSYECVDRFRRALRPDVSLAGISLEPQFYKLREILSKIKPNTLIKLEKSYFSVCLTHDIDGPFLHRAFPVFRSFLYALRGSRVELQALLFALLGSTLNEKDPYFAFNSWEKFYSEWKIRPTNFVYVPSADRHMNDPRYRISEKLKNKLLKIRERGGELGIHFGINDANYLDFDGPSNTFYKIFGFRPKSTRTHYWSGNWESPMRYWNTLEKSSVLTDCTFSSLEDGSFRNGVATPFLPTIDKIENVQDALVVLPTHIMDAYWIENKHSNSINKRIDALASNIQTNNFVNLDWHVRTASGIGPWSNYPLYLVTLLLTLSAVKPLRFYTVTEYAELWRKRFADCVKEDLLCEIL